MAETHPAVHEVLTKMKDEEHEVKLPIKLSIFHMLPAIIEILLLSICVYGFIIHQTVVQFKLHMVQIVLPFTIIERGYAFQAKTSQSSIRFVSILLVDHNVRVAHGAIGRAGIELCDRSAFDSEMLHTSQRLFHSARQLSSVGVKVQHCAVIAFKVGQERFGDEVFALRVEDSRNFMSLCGADQGYPICGEGSGLERVNMIFDDGY